MRMIGIDRLGQQAAADARAVRLEHDDLPGTRTQQFARRDEAADARADDRDPCIVRAFGRQRAETAAGAGQESAIVVQRVDVR
ncbi:hypothetical protein [Burkholderia pyrrocinia]|uniref:hypothetical protein n=1 Tax=Burkholderia pyrrocinia TaxID=60550 RepID=UPI000A758E3E